MWFGGKDFFSKSPWAPKPHQTLLPNCGTYGLILDGSTLPFAFLCYTVKVDILQAPGTRGDRGHGVGWFKFAIMALFYVGGMTKLGLGNNLGNLCPVLYCLS